MKLLLDECIDRKFAREFVDYEVKTVPQMGWAGIKNGQLLALAEVEFDVLALLNQGMIRERRDRQKLTPMRIKYNAMS